MATRIEIAPHELPHWMYQAQRRTNWGVLIALLFSITAAWPFLLQPGLPRYNATENYVFRAADYATSLEEGRLYPRWSPHVLGGYGAPIPNYYPPGAAYGAALMQVLFTDDPVLAVRALYIAAFVIAGLATSALVARRSDAATGALASVLYVYSPYVGLVAPHILGDLPAVIAVGLMPALLWSADRLLTGNRPFGIALTAAMMFALLVTHPPVGILSLVVVALFVAGDVWLRGRQSHWLPVVAALALGIALAAFYWWPALHERDLVRWQEAFPMDTPLLALATLIRPLEQVDLAAIVPRPQFTLGIVIPLFALLGGIRTLATPKQSAFHSFFLIAGLALIAIALLILPHATWLLGPITLCLAIAGSSALPFISSKLRRLRRRMVLPAMLIVTLIVSHPVWLAPGWPDTFGSVTPEAQILYEQLGYGVAVLPPEADLPATISPSLAPNRFLLEGYQLGTPDRIARNRLSGNIQANLLMSEAHSTRYQVQVLRPSDLDLLTAYFPGWRATLSGAPVPLSPDEQTGLMRINLPQTRNGELEITLGSTATRSAAWLVTWAALAVLLLLTWRRVRKAGQHIDAFELLETAEVRLLGVLWLGFTAIVLIFATPDSPLTLRTPPGAALDNSTPLDSRTNVGLAMLAFRLDETRPNAGDVLELTLYWRTLRTLQENYQVQIHLESLRDGTRWSRTDFKHPGNYPSSRWNTRGYIADSYTIPLPASIPPGVYQPVIEVYECRLRCASDNLRVTFFQADGDFFGQALTLPTQIVIR